jgi:hypothetical protein
MLRNPDFSLILTCAEGTCAERVETNTARMRRRELHFISGLLQ